MLDSRRAVLAKLGSGPAANLLEVRSQASSRFTKSRSIKCADCPADATQADATGTISISIAYPPLLDHSIYGVLPQGTAMTNAVPAPVTAPHVNEDRHRDNADRRNVMRRDGEQRSVLTKHCIVHRNVDLVPVHMNTGML